MMIKQQAGPVSVEPAPIEAAPSPAELRRAELERERDDIRNQLQAIAIALRPVPRGLTASQQRDRAELFAKRRELEKQYARVVADLDVLDAPRQLEAKARAERARVLAWNIAQSAARLPQAKQRETQARGAFDAATAERERLEKQIADAEAELARLEVIDGR